MPMQQVHSGGGSIFGAFVGINASFGNHVPLNFDNADVMGPTMGKNGQIVL